MSFDNHEIDEKAFDFGFGDLPDCSLHDGYFDSSGPSHIELFESPTASGGEPQSTSTAFEDAHLPHSHFILDDLLCSLTGDLRRSQEENGLKCLRATPSTQLHKFEENKIHQSTTHRSVTSNPSPDLLHGLRTLDPALLQAPNAGDILGYSSSPICSPFTGGGPWNPPGGYLPSEPATFSSADRIELKLNEFAIDKLPAEKGKRRFFSKSVRNTLKAWFEDHQKYPYPTKEEGSALATRTGLTLRQVRTFLGNMRARLTQPGSCRFSHLGCTMLTFNNLRGIEQQR
jgi:hypothetical protein